MDLFHVIQIAFAVFAFFALLNAILFWISDDGWLRKMLIIRESSLAWCCAIWAWCYPLDKRVDWMVFGLITIVPIAIASSCLSTYLVYMLIKAKRRK